MRLVRTVLLCAICLAVFYGGVPMAHAAIGRDDSRPQDIAPPAMTPAERMELAFPGFRPGGEGAGLFPGRMLSQTFDAWPPMRYLGDSAEIAGKTFTVTDVLIVPGGNEPLAYEPATGRRRSAPDGLSTNVFDFSDNTEVFIPPNATLVMVQVAVEPEAVEPPPGYAGCTSINERDYARILRVSYSEFAETQVILTDRDENFGGLRSPRIYCFTSGWLYFHVATSNLDPSQLWFEIVDDEFDHQVAIWTLTARP